MKVLTLHQPYASLISIGVKTIETRSWSTNFRGALAIQAAARHPDIGRVCGEWEVDRTDDGRWFIDRGRTEERTQTLFLGAIVATCTLVDVVPTELCQDIAGCGGGWYALGSVVTNIHGESAAVLTDPRQRLYGDFTAGRWAWLLADIAPVDPPVRFKGGQGLTKTWEPAAA